MEAKLWIPLLITILLPVLLPDVHASSIKPMSPMVGIVGLSLDFTCDATVTEFPDAEIIVVKKVVSVTDETDIVRLMNPNFDQPPSDTAKYELSKISKHAFNITIKDVQYTDAAYYRCELLAGNKKEQASLVVVRAPVITMKDKIQAEVTTQIICDAACEAPSGLTDQSYLPDIAASVGGTWLPGGTTVNEGGKIEKTWNTSFGAADDQKELLCKVFTVVPVFELTATKTVNVLYDVQKINFVPEKAEYAVGEEINCTADGNPPATITWSFITTNTKSPNVGHTLLIRESMMGEKKENWKCQAVNPDTETTIEKTIEFTVVKRAEPSAPPNTGGESPTAAIAAGVTVPLVIIIAVVIIVVIVIMRKKKSKTAKPPPNDPEGPVSSGPFTNQVVQDDNPDGKPNNKLTAYQSEKPSIPPHQQPYSNDPNGQNAAYEPSKYDEDINMDMSAKLARRALTPLPGEEADYDIPYNDERGQPRIASYPPPPRGPPPSDLPPDQQYSVVHRPPPTPTDYPDMAAAHPGLQQVYNMPKPRVVPRQPSDTTV